MVDGVSYRGEANPRTMLVEGPFGAGKTSYALETLFEWLGAGVPPEKILVLVPQRTLAHPYYAALRAADYRATGNVDVRTVTGLATDLVGLYWPLIAEDAGFHEPGGSPTFLSIETAQYAMSPFVQEAVERGEFDAVNVSPQDIARQVIDNMGKAALMGIPFTDVPDLLAAGWGPDRPRKRILAYQAAGRVAERFRAYCLERRLLDYSLQIELFRGLIYRPAVQNHLFESRTHLIAEHVEEDTPLSHSLIEMWLPYLEGALLTYEWWAGYRVFLGADPEGARNLVDVCEAVVTLERSFVTSAHTGALVDEIGLALHHDAGQPAPDGASPAFEYAFHHYYPEMLDWVAGTIAQLVHDDGVPPGEIAVVAPFLSDALRFSLGQKLDALGVPHISHRPSRALRDEPAARTVLTLAALAHPEWNELPPGADVAHALRAAIDGLDPVRAGLLAKVIYRPGADEHLATFHGIVPDMQTRITFRAGERYERLRNWLLDAAGDPRVPLDHLFSRLFGEVLSQPGYGFHDDPEAGRVVAELVESARRFRQALFGDRPVVPAEVGRRYYTIVEQGLLAGLYVRSWRDEMADAVFMAPAYTFLLRNRAVDFQFWLDVGSTGWWERLDQPLTHPYVLSPGWPRGERWTDADEYEHQQDMLYRILTGLTRRCRAGVYLGISDLGEGGYEQRGPVLRVFQSILHRHPRREEAPRA
jgi:hypothetical protein